MNLNQKISQIRKQKQLTIKELHTKIIEIFGKDALSYRTLLRIENGQTDGQGNSLHQICLGLGITLKELKEGTEKELGVTDHFRKNHRQGKYTYNNKAFSEILTGAKRSFLALELNIEPHGKTSIEKDPDNKLHEKWIYVLKGKITCIIGEEKFQLNKSDSICFDSRITHCFENNTSQKASCILIQNPRHI